MLARAAAARRAATLSGLAAPRIASRQIPSAARRISFWPLRKKPKPDPTLPVYFPKPEKTQRRIPWRKIRYGVFTVMVYYALFQVYMSVVLDPLLDWAEDEWDSLSEKEKQEIEDEEEDDEEPILFLPFPFTTKQVPQPPYKGSDPEWKTFVQINKDPKRQREMKSSLTEMVRRGIEANPQLARVMGGKTTKVRKWWLDIIYPPAPPPKHYIAGLILDYDGLFWGERAIESLTAKQLESIMYPTAVARAVATFWTVLLSRTKSDISRALGFEQPKEKETSWQSVFINRSKEQASVGEQPGRPPMPGIMSPNPQSKDAQSGTIQGAPYFAGLLGKTGEGGEVPMSASMSHALQAAYVTMVKNWKANEPPVKRGSIRVDGLIEIQGKAALMVVYVVAWYDPEAKKYVNVKTQLKHLMKIKQKPLGGA